MSKVYLSPLVYIKERKLIIKRQLSLYERVTFSRNLMWHGLSLHQLEDVLVGGIY